MARGRGNGGAVAGPGALARRTDLTPAGQPVRVPGGQPFGDRQASEQLQQAAPLAAGSPSLPPGAPPTGAAPASPIDVFGPSAQPDVPISAPNQSRVLPEDPDMVLRLLYSIYPHPDIARLIDLDAT